ncbi:heterokaryon incompatibility protein-domain-containing protein, partial [Podospora didyma]
MVKYTALSHRWGPNGVQFIVTTRNMNELERKIPMADLSPTFRDGITITRQLKIRYLWIDALCIIQDDDEDWRRESAKMASVFHQAYLTLAAASPNSESKGFGLAHVECAMQFQSGAKILLKPADSTAQSHYWQVLKGSPMHDRGWIFQEMVLSSRIVHFLDGQLFWQCHSLLESEDRTVRTTENKFWNRNYSARNDFELKSSGITDGPLLSFSDFLESGASSDGFSWWFWVLEHSRRAFTYDKDSIPSLAGAAEFYRTLSGDEPVLGLWRRDIAFHLGWVVSSKDGLGVEQPRDPRQPTWSWTCI